MGFLPKGELVFRQVIRIIGDEKFNGTWSVRKLPE